MQASKALCDCAGKSRYYSEVTATRRLEEIREEAIRVTAFGLVFLLFHEHGAMSRKVFPSSDALR